MSAERKVYIDARSPTGLQDLLFQVRLIAEQRRQFAVVFDADGYATLCTPDVGNRHPAHPQPTPPLEQAQRKVA